MENRGLLDAPIATQPNSSNVMGDTSMQREISEVQGAIILAKKFPRNIKEAYDRIMTSCQRPSLAESAVYSYSKGGTEITGPSIRLAEAMAQSWQNLQFGIRELEQRQGESTVEAFAWDVENNVRQVKVFQVKHIRYTKKGSYALDDPREIYELTANNGARRLRACILGIIPGDIVEAAVDECEKTMKAKADTGPEGIKKLLEAFSSVGVEKDQIEKRIQRRIDTITPAQVVSLRKVFNSLRDGMSTASDWFEVGDQKEPPKTGVEAAKEALKKSKSEEPPPEEIPSPPPGDTAQGPTEEQVQKDPQDRGMLPRDNEVKNTKPLTDEEIDKKILEFTDPTNLFRWYTPVKETLSGERQQKYNKIIMDRMAKLKRGQEINAAKKWREL